MSVKTDKELIDWYLNGDNHCFDELVQRYKDTVFNNCLSVVENHHDANEVAQDVWVKLAQSGLEKFKFDSKFSTYLYPICKNLSINRYNKNKKESKVFPKEDAYGEPLPDVDSYPIPKSNPREILAKKEKKEILNKAIRSLSADHREIINLTDFQGHSIPEAAEILNISLSAAKSRRHEARNRLFDLLEDQKDDLLWKR